MRSYRLNSIFISFSPLGEKEQSGAVLWTELYFHFFLFLGEEGTVWGAYRLSALSSWGRGNSPGRSYRLNSIVFSPFPLGERNSLVRSYRLNAIDFSPFPLEGKE